MLVRPSLLFLNVTRMVPPGLTCSVGPSSLVGSTAPPAGVAVNGTVSSCVPETEIVCAFMSRVTATSVPWETWLGSSKGSPAVGFHGATVVDGEVADGVSESLQPVRNSTAAAAKASARLIVFPSPEGSRLRLSTITLASSRDHGPTPTMRPGVPWRQGAEHMGETGGILDRAA